MKIPFRVSAVLLGLFFLGHTAGGMLQQKSMGVASDVVFAQMKAVHFDFNGSDSTWYGFWFGFGLMASAFLLLSAVMAWQLGNVPKEGWANVRVIAWALFAAMVATAVLSWKYFFAAPGTFATLSSALLAYGNLRKQRA